MAMERAPAVVESVKDVLWPGMYGFVEPNLESLSGSGMEEQINGKAVSKIPDEKTLLEWSEGTMGLEKCGGPKHMGGWFATRSVMVEWRGARRRAKSTVFKNGKSHAKKEFKKDIKRELYYYCAGDERICHFNRLQSTFNVKHFRMVLNRQVQAMVTVARKHVRTSESAYGWISNVIHKEVDHAHPIFRTICCVSDLDLTVHMHTMLDKYLVLFFKAPVASGYATKLPRPLHPPEDEEDGVQFRTPRAKQPKTPTK